MPLIFELVIVQIILSISVLLTSEKIYRRKVSWVGVLRLMQSTITLTVWVATSRKPILKMGLQIKGQERAQCHALDIL